MRLNSRLALAAAGAALCLAGNASAQVVGPGTNLPVNSGLDTAGGRVNIDLSNAPTLPAGQYVATLFNYDAGGAGDVTPFLAVDNGANAYTAIAVGTTQTVTGVADNASVPFGGSATFTLAAPTRVFAGIASSTQNPIILDDTLCCTDHEGGGQGAGTYVVTLNGTVPGDGGISNPDLDRQYAFSINVQLVPEPASLGLLGLGALGLLARRRRA